MDSKSLFSRLFNNKDISKKIVIFVNEIKNEYSLEGSVNVYLTEKYSIKNGFFEPNDNDFIVRIGTKESREHNKLSKSEWITLKNTIVHELTHVKNRLEMTQDTREKLNNNMYSLAHFAMMLVDEYNAYKTADDRFKQFSMGSEESELQITLQLFWDNKRFKQVNKLDANRRFNHLYDACTAIIVHSIRNRKFPSISEMYSGYNNMCVRIMEVLGLYNSRMPLDYATYEEVGKELWIALLIMVPQDSIRNFKKNVGIRL